ncbi:MAG: hypothetical protein GF411_01045 [Candidatus Lokiarchaeota archaeon]|nr:hypothetical protein [Candidatus Lokiarchaeota archaeon]
MDSEIEKADIFVLQADGKIDSTHGYGYPIQQRFSEHDIHVVIVHFADNVDILDELPKKPLVISGGMTEVTADIDWIRDSKAWFLDLIKENQSLDKENRQPVFGICFGAQLLIEAYAKGSVRFLEDPEIGVSRVKLDRPEHPIFRGISNEFDAYSFHYNQIWSNEVTILSQHKHMGHHFIQAYEIEGSSVMGVQFHPEFKQEEMKTLFTTYKDLIANFGFDLEPTINNLPKIKYPHRILLNFYNSY